jgi:hypothetical protein
MADEIEDLPPQEVSVTPNPVCFECRRYSGRWRSCDAFDGEIPDVIWQEGHRHRTPVEGDHGKLFVELPQP